MDSAGYMTCALKVETQTPGWHKTLMKVLKSIKGLSFTIDAERGIARVSGKIDPDKLLLILAKAGKHADLLWVDSGRHLTSNNNAQKMPNNAYGCPPPFMHGNGYGYYDNYGYGPYGAMDYNYMDDPHMYSQHQAFPYYYPGYPYYEPPARYFPQAPPGPLNSRQESYCNMM